MAQGQGVQSDLKAAGGPASANAAVTGNSATTKYDQVSDDGTKLITQVGGLEDLQSPPKTLNIDWTAEFREALIYACEEDNRIRYTTPTNPIPTRL